MSPRDQHLGQQASEELGSETGRRFDSEPAYDVDGDELPPQNKIAHGFHGRTLPDTNVQAESRCPDVVDYDPLDNVPLLGTRATNIVVRVGFRSVRAAQVTPVDQLLSLRNCGVGVVAEIRNLNLQQRAADMAEAGYPTRVRPTPAQARQLLFESISDRSTRCPTWASRGRDTIDWFVRPHIDDAISHFGRTRLADVVALSDSVLMGEVGLGVGDVACLRELETAAQGLDETAANGYSVGDSGNRATEIRDLSRVPLIPRVRKTLIEAGVETMADLGSFTLDDLAELHGFGRAGAAYVAEPVHAIGMELKESEDHKDWRRQVHPGLRAGQMKEIGLTQCGFSTQAMEELAALHNGHAYDLTSWAPGKLRSLVSTRTWFEVGYLVTHLRMPWRDTVNEPTFSGPLRLVKDYTRENGHAPGAHKGFLYRGERLGQWVMWVGHKHKVGELDACRVYELETIPGWGWNRGQRARARQGDQLIVDAEAHVAKHGDIRLTSNEPLFKAMTKVRTDGRDAMHEQHRARLEALPGWTWDQDAADAIAAEVRTERKRNRPPSAEWLANWTRVRDIAEQHDGLDQAIDWAAIPDGPNLTHWVSAQRTRRRQLSTAQVEHLERLLGWTWNGMAARDARQWMVSFEQLTRFVSEHGTSQMPALQKFEGAGLGDWVRRQRRSRSELAEAQVKMLEDLPGWEWHDATPENRKRSPRASKATRLRRELKWEANRRLAASYYTQHGHWPPASYVTDSGIRLGNWVLMQRFAGRNRELTADRHQALDNTPGWRWHGQAQRGGQHGMTFQRMCEVLGIESGTLLVSKPTSMYQVVAIVNEDFAIDLGVAGSKGLETPQRAWLKATGHQSSAAGWDMWGVETGTSWTSLRDLRARAQEKEPG